jgi:hypothetical protein
VTPKPALSVVELAALLFSVAILVAALISCILDMPNHWRFVWLRLRNVFFGLRIFVIELQWVPALQGILTRYFLRRVENMFGTSYKPYFLPIASGNT